MTDVINQLIKWQTDIGNTERNEEMAVRHIGFVLEECAENLRAIGHHMAVDIDWIAKTLKRFKSSDYWASFMGANPLTLETRVRLIDGFADATVFGIAGLMRCGVDPIRALQTVADSNESKRMPDGSFMRNEHGKIMKPPHYKEPDWSWVK